MRIWIMFQSEIESLGIDLITCSTSDHKTIYTGTFLMFCRKTEIMIQSNPTNKGIMIVFSSYRCVDFIIFSKIWRRISIMMFDEK